MDCLVITLKLNLYNKIFTVTINFRLMLLFKVFYQ